MHMTETTIVQPGTTPSIYTTGHQSHNDRHHGYDSVEARADFRSLTAEVERFGTINGDRITGGTLSTADRIKDGFAVAGDRVTAVGTAGQLASCRTDSLVQAGFAATSDRNCASTKDITGAITNGAAAAALAACRTVDEVHAVYASLQKQASDAATAVVAYAKDAQATAYQIEGRQALDAAKGFAAVGLKQTADYNGLTVLGERIRAELGAKGDAGFSAAALLSSQSLSTILAAIEKCCCEASKERAANQAATMAAIAASFTATTATMTAGFGALNNKMDQATIDGLRAQLVATQRLIPVTIAVGA